MKTVNPFIENSDVKINLQKLHKIAIFEYRF